MKQKLKFKKVEKTPTRFACRLFSSPADSTGMHVSFDVTKTMAEGQLLMDDVIDRAYELLLKTYPETYYPHAFVGEYEVLNETLQEWFPCVGEGDKKDDEIDKMDAKMVLVLPYARYSLSGWYKLYMALSDDGWKLPKPDEFRRFVEEAGLYSK